MKISYTKYKDGTRAAGFYASNFDSEDISGIDVRFHIWTYDEGRVICTYSMSGRTLESRWSSRKISWRDTRDGFFETIQHIFNHYRFVGLARIGDVHYEEFEAA